MGNRFNIYAFGAAFVLLAIYIVKTIVSGLSAISLMRVAIALSPFFLVIVIASRKRWLAWLLAFWMMNITIPIMLFDTFTLGFVFVVMIAFVFIVEKLVQQTAFIRLSELSSWVLLAAGGIIIARFLMDRPGSARLGGTGGLRHAISYSVAVPLFFITDQLARESFRSRMILRTVLGVGILMLLWRILLRCVSVQAIPFYFGWYEGPIWFLTPLCLAMLLKRVRQNRLPLLIPFIFSFFALLLAVLSPFRSRIYFALASIAAVFWCFGYRRRLLLGSVIAFSMLVPILTIMPKQVVPVVARRALSTILPYERADVSAMVDRGIVASGETGWTSTFRSALLEAGIKKIRKNPLLGQGWSFTADELMLSSSLKGAGWGSNSLITAGDYHNSIITVAVKCGLPAALALTYGLFVLLWKAGMRQYDGADVDFQILYAGLVGVVVTIFGQMLMNGSGQDLQAVCVMLGFFHGSRHRFDSEVESGDEDA